LLSRYKYFKSVNISYRMIIWLLPFQSVSRVKQITSIKINRTGRLINTTIISKTHIYNPGVLPTIGKCQGYLVSNQHHPRLPLKTTIMILMIHCWSTKSLERMMTRRMTMTEAQIVTRTSLTRVVTHWTLAILHSQCRLLTMP
jgi:hypothetical protein